MQSITRTYFFSFLLSLCYYAHIAEAKIVVKGVDCLGNLTVFDYTTNSGLTISSIGWDFGDGYSSVNIKTNHIYKTTGIFKVRVLANLSNGNKETDSTMLEIVNLPVASFEYMSYSDSCFYNNYICFADSSKPAITSQTITKRIIIWGDGGSDISGAPKSGDMLCHKYANTGTYKATMEVTDKYGCKDVTSFSYNIVGSVNTEIVSSMQYEDCKNMAACFYNNSQVKQPAIVKYYWRIDSLGLDSNTYLINPKCIYYKSYKNVRATLVATTTAGCKDSVSKIVVVDIKPLPARLVLSDSVMCYGDSKIITVVGPSYTADDIEWSIDSSFYYRSLTSGLTFTPKGSRLYPGKHKLTCKIKRGKCTVILHANFEVKGPVAQFDVVNRYQCSTTRQVSMYNRTQFIDTNNAEYFWKIVDANGGKCTTDYAMDKNLYSNCNYASGTYHKHIYSMLSNSNKITFIAKDKTSGCVDSTTANVELLRCTKLFDKNNYKICQDDIFLLGFNGGVNDPYLFTLDSGKSWKPFPSLIMAPNKGQYNVGFIFRKYTTPWVENIGKDSLRIHQDTLEIYDTIYKSKVLEVLENKTDSISYKDYFLCGDYRVTVFFKNKVFYAGEKIEINWGDLTTSLLTFSETTYLDSIQHRFLTVGVNGNINIKLFNASGCNTLYTHTVNFGKEILVKFLTPLCLSNKICMQVNIMENRTGQKWTGFSKKSLIWMIDDSVKYTNQFSVCHQFKTAGLHRYKIIAIDSLLCTDTLKGNIFVQEVRAYIANAPKVLFCSELRQFLILHIV